MRERFAPLALLAATMLLLAAWLFGSYGGQPVDSYESAPEAFRARVDALVAAHGTGRMIESVPVVRPPEGDVPVLVRRWEFSPALELQAGKTYRLHLLAEDVVHSAAIGDAEVLLSPGRVRVVTLTAPAAGRVRIQCGEYCGLGHTKMIGSIEVVP
jgi:cytochrome c oxidase subunit II